MNSTNLIKLGQDYSPNDLISRMFLKSHLVKDTYIYGTRMTNKNLNKKSMKRLKDNKVNSEIIKLRDAFQNLSLKNNQAMLKEIVKKAKPIASVKRSIDHITPDQTMQFDENIDIYLNDVEENELDLVIHNDSDFKIHNKPSIIKEKNDNIFIPSGNKSIINGSIEKIAKSCLKSEDESFEEILKIDFKVIMPQVKEEEIKSFCKEPIFGADNFYLDLSSENENVSINNDPIIEGLKPLCATGTSIAKQKEEEQFIDDIATSISEDIKVLNELKKTSLQFHTNTQIYFTQIDGNIASTELIKKMTQDRERVILEKYVKKWKNFVNKRKNYISKQRQATLNKFFDKLTKKKKLASQPPGATNIAKLSVKDYNKYQHRYKVQKHIIALQRAKLEEQNRIIEELKYNKIVEATQKSVDAMKEEVLKTYHEVDRHLKPKMKCLTNELKIREIEEPNLVLHCLKVPQFLQRMEKRAREREEKHALIRERRKQMEEERIRLKQQEELAKAEMDKDEKIKRMQELKEKRKKEKIENIRKKQHAERMRALIVMADLHYEKTLMSKYGIRPLRILMEIKRDNIEKAKEHYKFQLKKNIFLRWMFYTEDMWYERNYKAEDFCRKKTLRKIFDCFKKNHYEYMMKKQVAEDYYDLYVTQLVFRKFREGFLLIKKEQELKWQKAVAYNNSNLLFKTFTCWRTLPALNALKREQEARKARWREKVLLVVPDYSPPDD